MRRTLTFALMLAAAAGTAVASAEDDLTSLSYISYLERYATVQPATEEDALEAVVNMPLVAGDRIDTAREARVEVVLPDGSFVWMDEYTSVSFDTVALSRDTDSDRTVLFLADGSIVVEISELGREQEATRIDGPSSTVHLTDAGVYRLDVASNGTLRVEVWTGLAEAATPAGGVLVRTESSVEIAGGEIVNEAASLTLDDDFALWVHERRNPVTGDSTEHVTPTHARQAAILDSYGSWIYVDTYNTWAWRPSVSVDWRPYHSGRWYWTPVGWSWISYEPWGWLPYHYGSWTHHSHWGWVWTWHRYWSPAWVTWMSWGNSVAWCPVGYYDYWYWPSYYRWYGYHDPWWWHGHGGGHGGVGTPRRDVVPPGGDVRSVNGRLAPPSRLTLDVGGRVRVDDVDAAGWTAVSADDFASPHLPRLARSGEEALRTSGDSMGVVRSGPLTTPNPGEVRIREGLSRAFADVDASRDVTPIMSRSSDLRGEEAMRLVQPVTASSVARRSAEDVRRSAGSAPAATDTPGPALTARAPSPLRTRADDGAVTRRPGNIHRPSVPSTWTSDGPSSSRPVVRPTAPGSGPVSRPGGFDRPSADGARRGPTVAPPPSSGSRQPAPAPRSSVGSDRGSSSRPVIIPRTSSPSPRSSVGSSGGRRAPTASSGSSSYRRPSTASRPSYRPSSRPSTPSVRSSSGSSRAPSVSRSRPSASSSGGSSRPSSGSSSSAAKRR